MLSLFKSFYEFSSELAKFVITFYCLLFSSFDTRDSLDSTFLFLALTIAGINPRNRYAAAVHIVTNANVSQVLAHPISSSKTPPITGPITVPNALAVLNRAEALSLI